MVEERHGQRGREGEGEGERGRQYEASKIGKMRGRGLMVGLRCGWEFQSGG